MTTVAEKAHIGRVVALGCIAGHCGRPACFHHTGIRKTMGKKSSVYEGIPLCPDHHQDGGYGVAIHAGKRTWEAKYGTEAELVAEVYRRLDVETAMN